MPPHESVGGSYLHVGKRIWHIGGDLADELVELAMLRAPDQLPALHHVRVVLLD